MTRLRIALPLIALLFVVPPADALPPPVVDVCSGSFGGISDLLPGGVVQDACASIAIWFGPFGHAFTTPPTWRCQPPAGLGPAREVSVYCDRPCSHAAVTANVLQPGSGTITGTATCGGGFNLYSVTCTAPTHGNPCHAVFIGASLRGVTCKGQASANAWGYVRCSF